MILSARNPSGEVWVKRDDGYHCFLHGPSGANYGPLTYEEAYIRADRSLKLLRDMEAGDDPRV